jgi:hypothetical protein
MPAACVPQYKTGMMVIKMIEETFNQPFKTGPLIDQDGHYALFDILMNKAMFDYISEKHLFSKPGQREQIRSGLAIDFPSGQNPNPDKHVEGGAGAIMIKVSWKILNPDEIRSRKFHTVNALVSLPQPDPNVRPPCCHKHLAWSDFMWSTRRWAGRNGSGRRSSMSTMCRSNARSMPARLRIASASSTTPAVRTGARPIRPHRGRGSLIQRATSSFTAPSTARSPA